MITTSDNPYSPFTEFNQWYKYDIDAGYHTCAYLDRIALTSEVLSDLDNILAIQTAIDEIVTLNLTGNYRKVKRSDFAS